MDLSTFEIVDPAKFMQYDYAETKDLLRSFLTLVSATLVLSIAFSEKITKTHEADGRVRRLMFSSWMMYFSSTILGGLSVVLIAGAGGCALYGALIVFRCSGASLALTAWMVGVLAGAIYASGLVCMMLAARRAIRLNL